MCVCVTYIIKNFEHLQRLEKKKKLKIVRQAKNLYTLKYYRKLKRNVLYKKNKKYTY